MENLKSELIFRPASMADKEGILSMYHGLFCNMDALETERFDVYMNSKLRHSFLIEANGLVLSFLGLVIVDQGRTAYIYGARTREGYTAAGLYTRLLSFALQTVRRQFPVERVWLGSWHPKYSKDNFVDSEDRKLVLRKAMVGISLDLSQPAEFVLRLKNQRKTSHIHLIKPCEIVNYVESSTWRRCLQGFAFFYDYYCCEPTRENEEAFLELLRSAFVGLNKDGEAESISTRGSFMTARGCIRADIGIDGPDTDSALSHALLNIEQLHQLYPNQNVEVFFHLDNQTDDVRFEDYLTSDKTQNFMKCGITPPGHRQSCVIELIGR